MPGYALYDRSEWLAEHHQQHPDISLLDAWLDFAAIKYQAESPAEDNSANGYTSRSQCLVSWYR